MDIFRLAQKNIFQRRGRSFSCILIISISIAIFIVSQSLGESIKESANSEILQKTIQNEITVEAFEFGEDINYSDILTLEQISNVDYVTPVNSAFMGIKAVDTEFNKNIRAASCVGMQYETVENILLASDKNSEENYVIVPHIFEFEEGIYFGENLLGTKITFGYTDSEGANAGEIVYIERVVGAVYDEQYLSLAPNTILFQEEDLNEVIAGYLEVDVEEYVQGRAYEYVSVYVQDTDKIEETKNEIMKNGYKATTPGDKEGLTPGVVRYIVWIGGGIGGIILILGSISIMTLIAQATNQRKSEIGILKAIGFHNGHIRKLFSYEVLFLGVLGTLTGIVLGGVILAILNVKIAQEYEEILSIGIHLKSIAIGICLGIFVPYGITFLQIWKAGKIAPAIAMRKE